MNILPEDNNLISTCDLGCAGALVSMNFELRSIDRADERKAHFIFDRTTDIEQIIEDYWSDRLKISPRVFFDNIRLLKNRLYSN